MGAEQRQGNSEQKICLDELRKFLGLMEEASPTGTSELIEVFGGLLGGGQVTKESLSENLGDEKKLMLGLKTLSAWMDKVKGDVNRKNPGVNLGGFMNVNFLERKALLAGARTLGVKWPDLKGISGNTAKIMEMFSSNVGKALENGLSAKEIIRELMRDSIGELRLEDDKQG